LPVRFEICGLFRALSDTCNVPVVVPTPVGVNTTSIMQLALEVSIDPQVVEETLKAPVVEIATFRSIVLWLLVSLNAFAALVFPTFVAGYLAVAGVNVAWAFPVPDSATVCGLFEALSLTESVPVRDPIWVGVKVTEIVQLFPPANALPQVFVCEKSPLVMMLVMRSVALPLLLSVAFFALLVAVTTTVPKERAVGDRLMFAPSISGFTVSVNVVEFVKLPDTPVMVTGTVPVAAVALAVRVSVLVEVVGFGTNPVVTPLGRPEADSVTLPLKPPVSVTVMVLVTLLP